jgi:uncharacterized membrane protein HdeD (DUF308 family)
MKGITCYRGPYLFEGLLYFVAGAVALILAGIFPASAQMIYGIIFLFSCLIMLMRTLMSAPVAGFLLSLLATAVYLVAGVWMVVVSNYSVNSLILFLAIVFWIHGVIDLLVSLQRFESNNWGLLFVAGIIVIVLAFIIWIQTGVVSAWTISILFGISYFVYASAMCLTALTAAKPTEQATEQSPESDSL